MKTRFDFNHGVLFLFTGAAIALTITAGFIYGKDVGSYVTAWLTLHGFATGANTMTSVGTALANRKGEDS